MPFSSPSVACFHPEQNKGKGWRGNKIIVIHQIYHKRHNWMEDKSSLSLSHRSRKASDSLQQVTLEYLKALCRAVENHEHPPGFLSRCSMCSSTKVGAIGQDGLVPVWHCPVAPRGSRAVTNTTGITHLCTAMPGEMGSVRDAVLCKFQF